MTRVEVDPKTQIARVGGGATWGMMNDATMAHGLATTGGIITAEAPILNFESPDFSSNLNKKTLDDHPINNRRWSSLAMTTPGVISDSNGFGLVSIRGISPQPSKARTFARWVRSFPAPPATYDHISGDMHSSACRSSSAYDIGSAGRLPLSPSR